MITACQYPCTKRDLKGTNLAVACRMDGDAWRQGPQLPRGLTLKQSEVRKAWSRVVEVRREVRGKEDPLEENKPSATC